MSEPNELLEGLLKLALMKKLVDDLGEVMSDDPNEPLFVAIKDEKLDQVQALLSKGADFKKEIQCSKGSMTAIHAAATFNRGKAIIEVLLKKGADINCKANQDWTPLHFATKTNNSVVMIEFLLVKGALVNARTEKTLMTPLLHAVLGENSVKVVEMLLDHGADITACDDDNYSALHFAVIKKSFMTAELLLQKGANPNAQDDENWTPLHHTAKHNPSTAMMELLLKHGGDANAKILLRRATVLHIAARYCSLEMNKLLVQYGGDVNFSDNLGATPLHLAAVNEDPDAALAIVKFFIQAGANPLAKNRIDQTPRENAIGFKSSYVHVIAYLRQQEAEARAKGTNSKSQGCQLQ